MTPLMMPDATTLRTARLTLEAPFPDRLLTDRYVSWLNDPTLMRFSEQRHRTHTLESCRAFVRGFDSGPNRLWAIEAVTDGLGHIGNITAMIDPNNSLADVGILIGAPAAKGRGYGLEAWTAVLDFLLKDLGLRKVTAGCIADNIPMRRIMERSGMRMDGRRERHFLVEGRAVDVVHAALFRQDQPSPPFQDTSAAP